MRSTRRVLGLITVAGVLVTLSGCSLLPFGSTPSSPSGSPSDATSTEVPQSQASETPQATPTVQPTPTANAHEMACEALLSVPELYAFNPNFALDSAATSPAGSPAALAGDAGGTVCVYVNLSSNETITLAQASLPADQLAAARDRATASGYLPTDAFGTSNGRLGYFSVSKGVGTAQVISASKWTVLSSSWFGSPTDALKFADPLLAKMG